MGFLLSVWFFNITSYIIDKVLFMVIRKNDEVLFLCCGFRIFKNGVREVVGNIFVFLYYFFGYI